MLTILRLLAIMALLLLLYPMAAGGVLASPPKLDIASEPLTSACRLAGPASAPSGSLVRGAALLAPAAGNDIFQASFDIGDWSGHLERFVLALTNEGQPSAAPARWDAGAILTGDGVVAGRPAPDQRKIYTSIVQPDGSSRMVPFTWETLSDAQRALLDIAPSQSSLLPSQPLIPPQKEPPPWPQRTSALSPQPSLPQRTSALSPQPSLPQQTFAPAARAHSDGLGAQRLAYLRGERSQEGLLFRRRSSLLGDSVNSAPVFVGPPLAIDNDPAYAAFYQHYRTRPDAIYLGANDGMLHAFNASDGRELFAYVPDALIASLNQLASPSYVHRAYVDGPASAGQARIGKDWKTILVSAMGGGAQGVFALDVSDPSHFDTGLGALWEFTDRDDPMMGNVTTAPQIARFRLRKGDDDDAVRDFAVVASGLNNYADDGHRSSAGNGALFLLALDKPSNVAWKLNLNYYRLVAPIGESSQANGLSAPALVTDVDGNVRYAYAGDLQGNLWRFDFTGNAPWSGAVGPGPGKKPLFIARDAHGARQPISQQPKVVYADGGGYLILFGTGRMLTRSDRSAASFATQSYYGILDSLSDPPDIIASRNELTPRLLQSASDTGSLSLSGGAIEAGSKGWYVDFLLSAQTGERSVGSGVLVDGQLLFNTLVPGKDACAPASGRSYVLDALTGLGSDRAFATVDSSVNVTSPLIGVTQDSYAAGPLVLSRPSPGAEHAPVRDPAGRVKAERRYAIVNAPVTGDRIKPLGRVSSVLRAGRLSWREVANWRELHDAAKR
jgi:type IV pilus assembly protein PilY1